MKTSALTLLAFLSLSSLVPMDALALTESQVETNIRSMVTGCPDFTVAPPAQGQTVDASAYGFLPGNNGGKNYTNLCNAIGYCKTHTPCQLVVPQGTYEVGEYGKHYSGGIFGLNGLTNFTFDGQGSTFLMESKSYFVYVQNCSHIAIQNMTLGWNWAKENVQSLAYVTNIDSAGNYMDLYFPYESNPATNAPIPSDFVEVDSTNFNFQREGLGVIGVWQMKLTNTVKVAPSTLRYFDNTGVVGTGWFTHNNNTHIGQYYIIRHYEYDYHGLENKNCDNLTYSNLTVHSTLGMGFHFHENQYCQIVDSRLVRDPGTYHLSGSADGINVGNSFGHFKIENVEIGNTGDDAINIHDTLSEGVLKTGTSTLTASNVISWQNPFHVGDTIELRADDFSPLPWTSTLTAIGSYHDGSSKTVSLTFADPLPTSPNVHDIIFNDHYNSDNLVVSGCYIHDNKVRGIVTHVGNATIENNQFVRNYGPGLFLVCLAGKYSEGCNPSNVVIRANVFDGNSIKRNLFPDLPNDVVIAGETTPVGVVNYPICKDIIFENNLVKNSTYAALEISSATNVLADNNTIEAPYRWDDDSSVPGCVVVQDCAEVVMNNNHLVLDPGVTSYKTNIYQDSTATPNVYLDAFIPNTLPSDWTTWDVGGVDLSGSAAYTNGTFTIKGSGVDIWSTSDSFQFVNQPWIGDGQIVARVTHVDETSDWAKAGLMFRDTLDPDSRNGIICLTPVKGVTMQSRTNTGELSYTTNTVSGSAPTWLLLQRVGNVLSGYQSSDAVNWSLVASNTVPMAENAYLGLAVTSKSNSVLNVSTFDHVSVGGAWLSQDIGSVGKAGSSQINYSNGLVTVQGSGVDIWNTNDSFRFLYQTCSGDNAIVARVTNIDYTSPWAKAAVMIRESLSPDSRNTTLFLSPSNVVSLQGRTTPSALSVTVSNTFGLPAPQWIKLVRSGSNMNAYRSSDGTSWVWAGTQSNNIASDYYIGLGVTSKTNNALTTAMFDNVSVGSAWTSEDIGNPGVAGSAGIDPETGTFTVSGAGLDIWSTSDQFQFVDQPFYGNGQIVARVLSVGDTSDWAKAGVMIRDTKAPDAINAVLFLTPTTNGIAFQGRTSSGGNSSNFKSLVGINAPYWLKLTRSGSTVTAYYSQYGTSWTMLGTPQTIAMSTNAWIGLAVGSKNNAMLNTSMFDNVTVTPAP